MPTFLSISEIPSTEDIMDSMQKAIDEIKTIEDQLEFAKHAIFSANTVFDVSLVSMEEIQRYRSVVMTMMEVGLNKQIKK